MKAKFTYWEEDGWFLGYLNEFPDTWTQGKDLEDLRVHLLDLYKEFTAGTLQPDHEYHVDELVVA